MQVKNIVILASLALLGSLPILWWELQPPPTQFNRKPLIGLGEVLAAETVRAIQARGNIIVVVPGGSDNSSMPGNGVWDAFQAELNKVPAIRIVAREFVALEAGGFPVCSMPDFSAICERHSSAAAIVFFVGIPDGFSLREWAPPESLPRILVVDTDRPLRLRYRDSLAKGWLSTLIGPRGDSLDDTPASPKSPRDWFQKHYQIYTSQNYETLPD